MGKSTITRVLRTVYHIPVWDADQAVRTLFVEDALLIQEIAALYPEVIVDGKISRIALRARAFDDEECLTTLEHLIHGRAFAQALLFLEKIRRLCIPLCVLDVPLLFEVAWDKVCTHTMVVHAPPFIQIQRLERRPDLDESKIQHILYRQWDLSKKKALATYTIQSGLSKGYTICQVKRILQDLKKEFYSYA